MEPLRIVSALSYLKQDEQPEETRTLDSITPKIRQERTQQLEDDAGQQGAFNPETGEINWDCPCLGGMAHGPCGEEFRAAFSCFVYSEQEPKGIDCIEKFKYVAISNSDISVFRSDLLTI